jgi:tRNA (Thr-GGU) A37 N-methylase
MREISYEIKPAGVIGPEVTHREASPRQGNEGVPDAWVAVDPAIAEGLEGIVAGSE